MNGRPVPRLALHFLTLSLTAALAGCANPGPAPELPVSAVPTQWSAGGAAQPQSQSPTELAAWWRRFGDAELSALIDDALAHNPGVRSALAALRQSRALADVAAAALAPAWTARARPSAATAMAAALTTTSASGWTPAGSPTCRAACGPAPAPPRATPAPRR